MTATPSARADLAIGVVMLLALAAGCGDGGTAPRPAALVPANVPLHLQPLGSFASGARLSGFEVTPSTIYSGATATGTVTLAVATLAATRVQLASSDTSAVRVPAEISLYRQRVDSFPVTTPPGAVGCAYVSARIGAESPHSRFVMVEPLPPRAARMRLQLSRPSVPAGGALTGTITLSELAGEYAEVRLESSRPDVVVPASVTVPVGTTTASFPIDAAGAVVYPDFEGCAVITATYGYGVYSTTRSRALLHLFQVGG